MAKPAFFATSQANTLKNDESPQMTSVMIPARLFMGFNVGVLAKSNPINLNAVTKLVEKSR